MTFRFGSRTYKTAPPEYSGSKPYGYRTNKAGKAYPLIHPVRNFTHQGKVWQCATCGYNILSNFDADIHTGKTGHLFYWHRDMEMIDR